ncbi:MAG: PAS domain S-box protein [Deltaproteobacteria bacterium]|nr:PAS domain S-box protein [Deltaproteobacteria bacterium]
MSLRGTIAALLGAVSILVLAMLYLGLTNAAGWHSHIIIIGLGVLAILSAWAAFAFMAGRALSPMAEVSDALARLAAGDPASRIDAAPWRGAEALVMAERLNRLIAATEEEALHCRAFVRTMPDPVFEIDGAGALVYVNEAARAVTGYDGAGAAPQAFDALLPPEYRRVFGEAVQDILMGEDLTGVELPVILKDGRHNWFEFTCAPVWKDGKVSAMRCVGRDIEERRRMMDELVAAKKEAEETSLKLQATVRDLEEFALLAVRRESKMQEIRERLQSVKRAGEAGNGAENN